MIPILHSYRPCLKFKNKNLSYSVWKNYTYIFLYFGVEILVNKTIKGWRIKSIFVVFTIVLVYTLWPVFILIWNNHYFLPCKTNWTVTYSVLLQIHRHTDEKYNAYYYGEFNIRNIILLNAQWNTMRTGEKIDWHVADE